MDNLNYAGFWWRLLAHIIDVVIFSVCNFIISLLLGLVLGIGLIAAGMDKGTINTISMLIGLVEGLSLQWLYYALFESSPWQATLGKKLCGLTVTDTDGLPLSFARASGRYWAKWVSNFTCLVGYVMAGFTERKQALHDKIASTLVLREVD